jgi:hypothetical protein
VGGGGGGSLVVFKDEQDTIDTSNWDTSTAGSATIGNASSLTTLTTFGASGDSVKYSTKNSYSIDAAVLRFKAIISAPAAHSERFAGFALPDFSRGVYIHLSGASTKEFEAVDGSGSATDAITNDLTSESEFEIVWETNSAKLYIDRTLVSTLTTHVPTDELLVIFAGQYVA